MLYQMWASLRGGAETSSFSFSLSRVAHSKQSYNSSSVPEIQPIDGDESRLDYGLEATSLARPPAKCLFDGCCCCCLLLSVYPCLLSWLTTNCKDTLPKASILYLYTYPQLPVVITRSSWHHRPPCRGCRHCHRQPSGQRHVASVRENTRPAFPPNP
jgi:hypothetical protein